MKDAARLEEIIGLQAALIEKQEEEIKIHKAKAEILLEMIALKNSIIDTLKSSIPISIKGEE